MSFHSNIIGITSLLRARISQNTIPSPYLHPAVKRAFPHGFSPGSEEDILEWCESNFGESAFIMWSDSSNAPQYGIDTGRAWFYYEGYVFFRHDVDATAFKLRFV